MIETVFLGLKSLFKHDTVAGVYVGPREEEYEEIHQV